MDFSLDETQRAVADLAATVLRGDPDDARARRRARRRAPATTRRSGRRWPRPACSASPCPTDLGGDGFGRGRGRPGADRGRPADAAAARPWPRSRSASCPSPRSAPPEQQRVTAGRGRRRAGAHRRAARRGRRLRCEPTDGALTGTRVGVPVRRAGAPHPRPHRRRHRGRSTRTAPGVTLRPHPDLDRGARVHRAPRRRAGRVDSLDAGPAEFDRYAVCGAAAVADGVLAGALRLTADHLRTREQFGRPLATFQAVAQQVADVYVIARTVHLAAVSSAWRLGTGLRRRRRPRRRRVLVGAANCRGRCRSATTCTAGSASTSPTRCTATTRTRRTSPASSAARPPAWTTWVPPSVCTRNRRYRGVRGPR